MESAGKLVVEARLKGSGMHWAPGNVTPLLALRGMLCSSQWEQKWPSLWQTWRYQLVQRREERWKRRRAERAAHVAAKQAAQPRDIEPKPKPLKTIINGKPTAAHPWKGGTLFARA